MSAGASSVALGNTAVSSGDQSSALGSSASATGAQATAVGFLSKAAGANAVAVGTGSTATGDYTVANGTNAAATTINAVALGHNATASGLNSVALGSHATDGGRANTVSVGGVGTERTVSNVAAGTLGTDAVNLDQLNAVSSTVTTQGNKIAALDGRQTVSEGNVATLQTQQAATALTANGALQRSGGLMTGNMNMGGHVIGGSGPAVLADDLITKGQVDLAISVANSRIDHVEEGVTRANRGVASAMAMSGVGMPDGKKFVLGGHVATFAGQQALGFSAGAMISKTMMLDAGVGVSTNGGPAGVRVGGQVAW